MEGKTFEDGILKGSMVKLRSLLNSFMKMVLPGFQCNVGFSLQEQMVVYIEKSHNFHFLLLQPSTKVRVMILYKSSIPLVLIIISIYTINIDTNCFKSNLVLKTP